MGVKLIYRRNKMIPNTRQYPLHPNYPAQVHVPTPAQATAPTQEAIEENEIQQSFEPDNHPNNHQNKLADPFEYINDLQDDMSKKQFLRPLFDRLMEKLSKPTLSANDVANILGFSHTRITRNYPNGTSLSFIMQNMPRPRQIDPEKLLDRLSPKAKAELLARLQAEVEANS